MSVGAALPSRGEELANALSHGVGLVGAIAATPILIVAAASRGSAAHVVGSSIFGATMILLYFASTWYHAVSESRLKDRLQKFDHAAIYLLIAGTYTPFTLGVLGGPWGWTLFGLVWGAATLGVVAKMVVGVRYPRISTALYVVMGWLVLIAIRPLIDTMQPEGIRLLFAGGVLYSGGVVFYAAERVRYSHFVWHVFVLAGSACHFFAVLWYAV
jgi:hemolysin III